MKLLHVHSFAALGALALAGSALAQSSVKPDARATGEYEYAGHYRLILSTGELIPEPLDGNPSAALECGDFIVGALTNIDASSRYVDGAIHPNDIEYIDWGVISKETASDIITEFRFGYATLDLDPSLGGPGGRVSLSFYEDYAGPCAVGDVVQANEIASFELSGLPGYDGVGLPLGYFMTIDLRGGMEFILPEGPFGFSMRYERAVDGFTTTGLIQSFAGSPDGDTQTPDANGMVTGLDNFEPNVATGSCTASKPDSTDVPTGILVGSHYLMLRKVDANASAPAQAVLRNDLGNQNPVSLLSGGTPVLGDSFSFVAASTGPAELGVFLAGFATPTELATSFGVLLVNVADPGGELLAPAGIAGPHLYSSGFVGVTSNLPPNVDLCDFDLSVQAVQFGTALRLTNAIDLTFGVY